MTKWDNSIWVEWLKPRHALTDIYISPEAMKDIQKWEEPEWVFKDNLMRFNRPNKNDDIFAGKGIQFTHLDYVFDHINRKQTKQKTIVIVSGYYAPLHINHIEMMEAARKLGDELWVIVNNDKQLLRKKGFCFQDERERYKIVSSLKCVDKAWVSEGDEEHIGWDIAKWVGGSWDELHAGTKWIFANGGDRVSPHPKEEELCNTLKIEMVYNVGPPKTTSSSDLIRRTINHYLYQGTK